MASVATKSGPAPRYGSPAEVAVYAGLSVKSVRRLIAGGSVPASKVGRRVVIPFRAVDRFIELRRAPVMASASTTVEPRSSVDARGRLVRRTAEEARRHAEAAIQALDEIATIGDEAERAATLDALIEGVDQDRMSYRKRFGPCE